MSNRNIFLFLQLYLFYYFLVERLMNSNLIDYEETHMCAGCWGNTNELINSPSNRLKLQNNRENGDKKLSLRRINKSQKKANEITSPSLKNSTNYSVIPQTLRYSAPDQTLLTSSNQPRFSNFQSASKKYQQNMKIVDQQQFQRINGNFYIPQKTNYKLIIEAPQVNLQYKKMVETTKLGRIGVNGGEELKKTRKNLPFMSKPIEGLSDLKQSVCSFSDENSVHQKLQQSEIMVDYFHPADNRLDDIEDYIKSRDVKQAQSYIFSAKLDN